jgi:hypothetical protein
VDIALARHVAHEGAPVAGGGLEQGPFASTVTELDAAHHVADQTVLAEARDLITVLFCAHERRGIQSYDSTETIFRADFGCKSASQNTCD